MKLNHWNSIIVVLVYMLCLMEENCHGSQIWLKTVCEKMRPEKWVLKIENSDNQGLTVPLIVRGSEVQAMFEMLQIESKSFFEYLQIS